MSNSLGEAVLDLAADQAGLIEDINSAKPKALTALDALGKAGGALLAAGIMIAATAIVAITGLIWSSANTMDAAYDKIQTRTGATGAELEGLKADFEAVFTSVPTDAETAANAIGILNSQLGATGPQLQDITANVLEFSRLTGTDATTNAQVFAQVVQNWQIPLDQASGSLDALFVAAQQTGVPVDQLMQQMVDSGPILRQYGFSFEETAAFLATMSQAGIDATSVMMGLKAAAAKFAAEGVDLNTGLQQTIDAIQSATDPTQALNIAVETFGARAGPAMVDAIRSGKLELKDLIPLLEDAEGAIQDTAEATMDWGERLQIFKNKVTTAFAPAGQKLMDVASKIMEVITQVFERPDVQAAILAIATWIGDMAEKAAAYIPVIVDAFFQFVSFLQNNQGVVVAILAAIGVAIAAFVYTTVIPAAIAAIAALWPILLVMAAVAAIAYLVYQAWTNNWGGIQEKLAAVWAFLQPIFAAIVSWLQTNIPIAIGVVSAFWTNTLLPAIQAVWAWLSGTLFPFLQSIANFLGEVFGFEVAALAAVWETTLWPAMKKVIDWMQANVLPVAQKVADFFKGQLAQAFQTLIGIINLVTAAIQAMTDALNSVQLPDDLTPGSPTPFEMGLRGIHAALMDINRLSLPKFNAQLQTVPIGAMTSAGMGAMAGGSNTTNVYLYGTQLGSAGRDTPLSEILDALNIPS